MAKTWKAGVIACGSIAQAMHLPGYEKCPGVELVGACDPEPKRLAEARKIGTKLKTYSDYRKMLADQQFDVISVCSPNKFHAQHAIAALEHGAHVVLEKPPAVTMKEIAAIKAAVKKSGRKLIVGFSHRLMRGNQKIQKLLKDGAIGEPYMIRVRFAHRGPYPGWAKNDWFYSPVLAIGGALLDMGIHAIDQALWHLGPVKRVQAMARTLRKDIRVDDNAVLLLEYANGKALGYIEVGWTCPSGFSGIEIMGDKGSIVHNYTSALTITTGRCSPDMKTRPKMKTRELDKDPTHGGWSIEIAEVVKALRADSDRGMGIDAGGAAVAVALAAYESSRTGKAAEVAKVR